MNRGGSRVVAAIAAAGICGVLVGAAGMWLVARDAAPAADQQDVSQATDACQSARTTSATPSSSTPSGVVEVPAASEVRVNLPEEIWGRKRLSEEMLNMGGGPFVSHLREALYPYWPPVQGFIPAVGAEYERPDPEMGGLGALKIVWMSDPTGSALIAPMTEEQLTAARQAWWTDSEPPSAYASRESNCSAWTCSIGPSPIPSVYTPRAFDAPPDTSFSICSWVLPGVGAMFIEDLDVKSLDQAMRNTAIVVNAVLKGLPSA